MAESADPADRAASLDLALSMTWYWSMIGANAEASAWLGLALSATEGTDHPGRSWARAAQALASISGGRDLPEQSWPDWQVRLHELSDELESAPAPQVPALQVLAPMLAFFSGDNDRANRLMELTLTSDDGWIRAAARIGRAGFAENEGDMALMREDVDAAYHDFSRIGDRWGLASVLAMRGNVRALDGDVAGAIDDYDQAMRYANELGSTDDDALIQLRLAGLRLRAGDSVGARAAIEALRADIADRSQGWERDLFADGMLLSIILQDGDEFGAAVMAADLRQRLGERPVDFLHGHAMAVVGGTTAQVAIMTGDVELAMADLRQDLSDRDGTMDMPVVATVGVSVALLAEALVRIRTRRHPGCGGQVARQRRRVGTDRSRSHDPAAGTARPRISTTAMPAERVGSGGCHCADDPACLLTVRREDVSTISPQAGRLRESSVLTSARSRAGVDLQVCGRSELIRPIRSRARSAAFRRRCPYGSLSEWRAGHDHLRGCAQQHDVVEAMVEPALVGLHPLTNRLRGRPGRGVA